LRHRAPTRPGRAHRLRLRQGALITAGSALVLLIAMFATSGLAWTRSPSAWRRARRSPHAANALHALTIVRWLMLATIVVAVGSLLAATAASRLPWLTAPNTGALVAVLASITAAG